MHKYPSFYHIAISGLREMHFDVNGYTSLVAVTADEHGIINLPEACIKVVRLSVYTADGRLTPVGHDPYLYTPKDACGNYSNQPPQATSFFYSPLWVNTYPEHWKNGEFIGGWYGVGGRSRAGEMKIDYKNGQIELGPWSAGVNYILEYIASEPDAINGKFYVHPYLIETIKAWIEYASKRRINGISKGEVEFLQKKYIDAKNWARQRLWNMDVDQLLDIARRYFGPAPKY